IPSDPPPLRDRLIEHGVRCYEADVRFAIRFLIDRGLRGAIAIHGEPIRTRDGVTRFDNPRLEPADWSPALRVLSLDIETDPRAESLLSIGLSGCGLSEVLLRMPEEAVAADAPTPERAVRFLRERDLLPALVQRVRRADPDILTGWNVVGFDLRVLDRLARAHGVRLALGRGGGVLRLRPSRSPRSEWEAIVPGRVVLDGIDLLRGAFVRMESYSLNHVASEVLGEEKLLTGRDRGEQILEAWRGDRQLLVDYNLKDARLVLDILAKMRLIELAVERSRLTGLPVDRVAGAIAAFDSLYLHELGRRALRAPNVGQTADTADRQTAALGGHVLEPEPGLFDNVLVFDFKSLYPSLIRTFQIDPLGFLGAIDDLDAESRAEAIVAPNGAAFDRRPGILPGLLDALFPRREAAKREGDSVASHAIKILMNSFYGVLGTTACRFYEPRLASAIPAWGKEILLWTRARLEALGHRVIYGDTDSLFVLSGADDAGAARRLGEELAPRLDAEIGAWIRERWSVESRLELEFEKLYRKLLLQETRGGRSGARKRYAGLVERADGTRETELIGLEAVRRDWTDLAKDVQRALYERLFADAPREDTSTAGTSGTGITETGTEGLAAYLRDVVRALRAGEHDAALVYRKALRKPLAEYTATTPPHVAAARKLGIERRPPRVVHYVMTRSGPEPVATDLDPRRAVAAVAERAPLDHEHYVQKQIRPIAEPVLARLDLVFEQAIGDDEQLRLF
ncbi:MAG: DNA polymerase II, partial [Acidobacteriota bacterium]